MGSIMGKDQGAVQAAPQQGLMYPPPQPQYVQQPMMQPRPQYVQQPMMQPQPQYVQQPMMQPQPQYYPQQPVMQQQPQYYPQQPPPQYRPFMPPPQQGAYQPSYPSGPSMPRYPSSSLSLPHGHDPSMSYENDAFLSSLTGWSVQDIERLRHEFLSYANPYGVIDRDGFRKLYIASLLNMTWEALERDAESAFRNFDINQTGGLDFNEYITACSRMAREVNTSSPPPTNPFYN